MNLSQAGKDLILSFESLRLKSYQDTDGVWTIGVGAIGPGIGPTTVWTKEQALDRFDKDIARFSTGVQSQLGTLPVTQNQFDALVCFAFNVGLEAFRTSTLLKKLRAGDIIGAADQFPRWNKDGGRVIKGLVRRRDAERTLFLKP